MGPPRNIMISCANGFLQMNCGGTCGLAETCRTHNLRVVSSSPGTANVVVDLSKPLYSALFRRPERYLVAT